MVAHPSADVSAVVTGLIRGAFEFQGQKCSAASRAYMPASIWPAIKAEMQAELATLKWDRPKILATSSTPSLTDDRSTKSRGTSTSQPMRPTQIVAGGGCDDSVGYFVEPTVIETSNPISRSVVKEIFGPVLTVYVYDDSTDDAFERILGGRLHFRIRLDRCVFPQDRYALDLASKKLENAAGNFYLNDKPTGAVVGQQPFGGARGSGTNDKAGSYLNLLRWVSPRTIKEALVSPTDYRYPFLGYPFQNAHKKGTRGGAFFCGLNAQSSVFRVGAYWDGRHVHTLSLSAHDRLERLGVLRLQGPIGLEPLGEHHHLVFFSCTTDRGDFAMNGSKAECTVQNAGLRRLLAGFWDLVNRHGVGDQLVVAHGTVSGAQTLLNEGTPNALRPALLEAANPLAVKPEEGLDAEVNDALDTPSLLNMSSTCCNSCVNR